MSEGLYLIINSVINIIGYTLLAYFVIKLLTKHTDFGQNKKKEIEKSDKIYSGQEESTASSQDILSMFGTSKPKIETSFGDERIGNVHEHEKKD